MLTDSNIKSSLEQMSYILISCRQLTFDGSHMLTTDTSAKFSAINRERFLTRVRESFWKLAVIELAKLYGDNRKNDHFSISIFIKDLRRHHSTSSWKDKITSDELRNLTAFFKTSDIQTRIKKLVELRNQHYAHSDNKPDNNKFDVKFYYDDSVFLIEKAEEIIKKLSCKFGHKIEFRKYQGEDMNRFMDKNVHRNPNR